MMTLTSRDNPSADDGHGANVDFVLPLREVDRHEVGRAGGKAANLGTLLHAGFPVPDGFVVTTGAFERFLHANGLDRSSPPEVVASAPMPADVLDSLLASAGPLTEVPLAVRSSGVAEDLAGASYAGQYETVLDVRGPAAVVDAVRQCWASAFSVRVAAYDARQGCGDQPRGGGMAVLVQRLVRADAAGVAFTANPVTGDRGETVVSAVHGLGERLVSGHASPDEWLVRGGEARRRSAPEDAIDARQALAVADLARRVEAYFGTPQDIEWAIADGELFLLQARPITTLSATAAPIQPVNASPPPGFWKREASHYPRPFSPLFRSVFLPTVNAALRNAFEEAGLLVEGVEHREIGGWVYIRLVPLGGKDRPTPPAWIMPVVRRLLPSLRSRIARCVASVRSDRFYGYIKKWYGAWRPELIARTAQLRAVSLAELSDTALDRHLSTVLRLVDDAQRMHQLLAAAVSVTLADLAFTCRDLLGWDDQRTFALLAGLSDKSTEPSRRLAELADLARQRPLVLEQLSRLEVVTPDRLAQADATFAEAFAAYQHEFGGRALRYEVADPTPAETPRLTLRLLRDQLASNYDATAGTTALLDARAAAVADARATLGQSDHTDAGRTRFNRALARAERAYPVREDNGFYTVGAPLALVRYVALEIGRRLASRNLIASRDDVFFLEIWEARAALYGNTTTDWRALVDQRQAERAWVEAHPGPASYGHEPPQHHDLSWLPVEARFAMEAMVWVIERITASEASGFEETASDGSLRGIAASPGRYTGPARVILSEDDFDRLQPGDVLVCPITSPVWSMLFPNIGALVTDTGGILSHPAIIAREYRVPAVVATGGATRLIRDGDLVTVDGNAGIVQRAA